MRVKQLWNYVPLPANIRLVWDRLTFSRLTTIYFAVALVHCFVQVTFQISALYTNSQAANVIAHIAATDPNAKSGFAVLTKGGPLRSCTGMPGSTGSTPCRMVWAGKVAPDAFGGYPEYSYGNMTMLASTSSPTLASTSSTIPSTGSSTRSFSTSTSTRTASTSTSADVVQSTATNVAIQTPSITSRSTSSSIASPTIITSIVSVTAPLTPPTPSSPAAVDPLAPGGSPITRVGPAKRMYIPNHVPGSTRPHMLSRRDLSLIPVFSQFNGTFMGVQLNGLTLENHAGSGNHDSDEAFISSVCVDVLQWPLQKLWNTQREDAVFIGFQFWVLGMSIVALLNESVPHIIAAFVTHILVTAWSVFQIVHTANFRSEFNRVTTHGACGGVNLLPTYWKARANAEIPVLVLNVVVLLLSAYMSWRLLKTFGWLTFKRVGASLEINRIYKLVLSLGIVIQLSLFFLIVSIALWLEELYHGPSAGESSLATLYKAIVIIQLVALGPWLVMGWYAVRREMRKTMIAFLTLSALFIVAWAGMFVCTVWRLTFLTWMFFRLISVIAATLTALAFALGIVCWFNFGKDFPKHLKLQEEGEENDFIPAQPTYDPEKGEKVDFPTQNAIPTFADAFSSRPSSIASSGEHSNSHLNVTPPHVVARPPTYHDFEVERPGHDRSGSIASTNSGSTVSVRDPFEQDLERVMSNHSRAAPSVWSATSSQPAPSVKLGMGKRWVIE